MVKWRSVTLAALMFPTGVIDSRRAANAAPAAWWCWVTSGEQSRVISRERRRIKFLGDLNIEPRALA
jgi:hypothetical protein